MVEIPESESVEDVIAEMISRAEVSALPYATQSYNKHLASSQSINEYLNP